MIAHGVPSAAQVAPRTRSKEGIKSGNAESMAVGVAAAVHAPSCDASRCVV
jgi:hypothetical protein